MTTQTDDRRLARTSPTGTLPVLRTEVAGGIPHARLAIPAEGELPRSGTAAARPSSPATDLYTEGFGWPVIAEGLNVLLRCGELADVLLMPSGLGGEVNHSLKLLSLDAAVFEVVGASSRQWAFLCRSQPTSITNLGVLSLRGVKHYGDGSYFTLPPSPACDSETLRWVCPPKPDATVLPLVATVTSCAQTAMQR